MMLVLLKKNLVSNIQTLQFQPRSVSPVETYVNAKIGSFLKEKMSHSQIGVYLVDQVARSANNRIFNLDLTGKIQFQMPVASDVSNMRKPRSFASDYLGKQYLSFVYSVPYMYIHCV